MEGMWHAQHRVAAAARLNMYMHETCERRREHGEDLRSVASVASGALSL